MILVLKGRKMTSKIKIGQRHCIKTVMADKNVNITTPIKFGKGIIIVFMSRTLVL